MFNTEYPAWLVAADKTTAVSEIDAVIALTENANTGANFYTASANTLLTTAATDPGVLWAAAVAAYGGGWAVNIDATNYTGKVNTAKNSCTTASGHL